eukprot:1148447-Pelagomonas_calceolata.AAC.2
MGVEAPVGQQVGDLVVLAPAWGARCGGPYCLGQRLGVYLWVAGRADAAALDVRALQQREHIFWTCPHAQAAVDVLAKNLPPGTPVLPQHVWLLVSPCPSVNKRHLQEHAFKFSNRGAERFCYLPREATLVGQLPFA